MNARNVIAAATLVVVAGLALPAIGQTGTAPPPPPAPAKPSPAPAKNPAHEAELQEKLKKQAEDQQKVAEKQAQQKQMAEQEFAEAQKKAAAGTGPVGVPGTPVPFTFANQVVDLGKITDDVPVPVVFKFKNVSDTTVKILNMSGSCGCTVPAKPPKDTFAPGEEGEVTATFNPANRRGREVKHVYMDTDYQKSPRMEMTFSVETLPRVLVEPMSMFLGERRRDDAGAGGQTLVITGRAANFDVTDVLLADRSKNFTFTRLDKTTIKGDDGADLTRIQYSVDLAPGLPIGPYRTSLVVATNDAKKPNVTVAVSAAVVGDLRLVPDRVSLVSTQMGQPWFRDIRIEHRRGESFAILGVEVVDLSPDFGAVMDVIPVTPNAALNQMGGYQIRIAGMTPTKGGQSTAKVIIRTNIKDQETIEVPLAVNIILAAPQQ